MLSELKHTLDNKINSLTRYVYDTTDNSTVTCRSCSVNLQFCGVLVWLSRDPIGVRGGINAYGFVGNDGVNHWDKLGLMMIAPVNDSPRVKGTIDEIYAGAYVIFDDEDAKTMSHSGGGILVHGKRVTVNLRHCTNPELNIKKSQTLQKRLVVSASFKTGYRTTQPATDDNAYNYFNLLTFNGPGNCYKGTIEVMSKWVLFPNGSDLPGLGPPGTDDLSGSLDGLGTHGSIAAFNGWPDSGITGPSATGWFNFTIRIKCGGDYDITAIAAPLYPKPLGRKVPPNPPDGYKRTEGYGWDEWPWYE